MDVIKTKDEVQLVIDLIKNVPPGTPVVYFYQLTIYGLGANLTTEIGIYFGSDGSNRVDLLGRVDRHQVDARHVGVWLPDEPLILSPNTQIYLDSSEIGIREVACIIGDV